MLELYNLEQFSYRTAAAQAAPTGNLAFSWTSNLTFLILHIILEAAAFCVQVDSTMFRVAIMFSFCNDLYIIQAENLLPKTNIEFNEGKKLYFLFTKNESLNALHS